MPQPKPSRWQLLVCEGPTCGGCKDAASLTQELVEARANRGAALRLGVLPYLCLGRCRDGPNLVARRVEDTEVLEAMPTIDRLERESTLYSHLSADQLDRILDAHLLGDEPDLQLGEPY